MEWKAYFDILNRLDVTHAWCCRARKFLIFMFCSVLILCSLDYVSFHTVCWLSYLRSAFDFHWQQKNPMRLQLFPVGLDFFSSVPVLVFEIIMRRVGCAYSLRHLFPISRNIETHDTTNSPTCNTILQRRHLSISRCRQRNSSVLRGSDRLDFYAIRLPSLHTSRCVAFFRNICCRLVIWCGNLLWEIVEYFETVTKRLHKCHWQLSYENLNKSSTVAEMAAQWCTTGVMKRWGLISFRGKLGEKGASAAMNHVMPKTRIFRLHYITLHFGKCFWLRKKFFFHLERIFNI